MGPERVSRDQLRRLRKLSAEEMYEYLKAVYVEGFKDGLEEAEHEFDDAVIMTEEEAANKLGEEAFNKLIGGA